MTQETHFGYRIADAFFRNRKTFYVALLSVAIVPFVVLQMRTRTYTASAATQVITEDMSTVLGEQKAYNWMSPAMQNINRFNDYLNDDGPNGFLASALHKAHLRRPIQVDPRFRDKRLEEFKKNLSVAPISDTVFTLGLVWNDAEECERIVRALQQEYIEQVGVSKQSDSFGAIQFLTDQIEGYAARMRTSELALIHYKQSHAGQSPEAQTDDLSQVSLLKTPLDELQVQERSAGLRKRVLQGRIDTLRKTVGLIPSPTNSPQQIQMKALADKRYALMMEGWLPGSDQVRMLDAQIGEGKQQSIEADRDRAAQKRDPIDEALKSNGLYQDLQQASTNAEIDSRSHQAQVQVLLQKIGAYEVRIRMNPSAESELNDRMRDYSSLKTQYEDLVKRREQMQMKASLDKIIASSTLKPIGTTYAQPTTSKSRMLMLAAELLLIGLGVGIVLIALNEWNDLSLRYESDAIHALNLPVLAVIPDARKLRIASSSETLS